MKKKLLICAIACVLLTGCGSKIPKLKNGEEALIEFGNGDKISATEIWNEVKTSYGLSVTLDKIDKKILEDEYKDKLKEVEEYISSYKASLVANYGSEEKVEEALTNYGYNSLADFLESQRISYLQDLAINDYAKSLVTDKEIKAYYKDEVVGDISCVHVLVKPESESDADLKTAKEKAEKIVAAIKKDIKSGTKAAAAFEKYKDDKTVTYEDLGYFNKGDMVTEFETAAYKLKKGAYTSSPVKTSYGYHIILKTDEKDKEDLKDIKDTVKEQIANKKVEEDKNVSINALVELRKSHGVKFHDSELEDAYNKFINYQLNAKEE